MMVTETDRMPTQEEKLAWSQKYEEEKQRIEDAIGAGIGQARAELSAKKQRKIVDLVEVALDALPYGMGANPLTDADVDFAQGFARRLAKLAGGK